MNAMKYYKERFADLYLAPTIHIAIGDRVVVAAGMISIEDFSPAYYTECTVVDIADDMVKLSSGVADFWCDRCLVVARVNKPAVGCCGGSSPCDQKDVPEVQAKNTMSPFCIEASE